MARRRKMSEGMSRAYDLLVIRNVGDKPITLRHRNIGDVDIEPGQQRTLPAAFALVNLGDPTKRDTQRMKERTGEVKRVRRKWGFNRGFVTNAAWFGVGHSVRDNSPAGPFCPPIEVYSLEGERLWFIHDDPDGTKTDQSDAIGVVEAAGDSRFVNSRIETLERELERMKGLLAMRQEFDASKSAALEAPPEELGLDEPDIADNRNKPTPKVPDAPVKQSQADRNKTADEMPRPSKRAVGKDRPRSTRPGPK